MRTRKGDRARSADRRAVIGILFAGVFLGGAAAVLLREAGAWMDPSGAEAATSSFVTRAKGASQTSSAASASHATAAKSVGSEAPAKPATVNHANDANATAAKATTAKPANPATAKSTAPATATAKNAAPATANAAAKGAPAKAQAASQPGVPAVAAESRANESVAVKRIRAAVQANAKVQAATPIEDQIQYQYNAIGRRDPFQAMVGNFVGDDVGGDAPVDVGGMRVVGIVWGADSFALVEDGSGNSLILRRGDKVMNGFVEDLKRDAVVVKLTMDGQTQSVAIPLTRKGEQSNGTR